MQTDQLIAKALDAESPRAPQIEDQRDLVGADFLPRRSVGSSTLAQ